MSYATLSDLQTLTGAEELIQLTDRADPPSDAIDVAVVNKALADTDELIDSYLLTRYALPLDPTPALLVGVACDIARFRLWKDRASEEVRKRYDDALKMLGRLSSGLQALPGAGGVTPPAKPGLVLMSGEERLFTRKSMRRL